MSARLEPRDALRTAELQFRLAAAVRLSVTNGKQPLDLPIVWSHGKQSVHYEEVPMTVEQADFAAWSLNRSATFLIAVAIKDAIKAAVSEPKSNSDIDVRGAYQISRLIRNAFAHGPFDPIWSIDPDCLNRVFEVRGIIRLDTKGLQGIPFDWRHYGGPLAIFRLSQFVRFEILKNERLSSRIIPMPKDIYYQQGDLVLKRVNDEEAPE